MAVATEKIIPRVLPPKEETEGVDFLAIFDSFDASKLFIEQLEKFASRNPYVTAYPREERHYIVDNIAYPVPSIPIKERLDHGKFCVGSYRKDLEDAVRAWKNGKKNGYKKARQVLVQSIGIKACAEYVQRIFDAMSEEEICDDQENWERWSRYCDEQSDSEEALFDEYIENLTEEDLDEHRAVPIVTL